MSTKTSPENIETANQEPIDTGTKEFKVGGVERTLTFSAAARFRLFLNVPPDDIQTYVTSDAFKIRAVSLLLIGKEALNKSVDEILDEYDAQGLTELESEAIYAWVLQKAVNFMLRDAEIHGQSIAQSKKTITRLVSSLDGQKD